jgi:hypothetical protein
MDKLILIIYCSHHISHEEREGILRIFREQGEDWKVFLVPITDGETRIECINPTFITNEEIVKKFQNDLKKANKNFERYLKSFPIRRKLLIEKI